MILKIIVMMVTLMLNMIMDYGEVCVEKGKIKSKRNGANNEII